MNQPLTRVNAPNRLAGRFGPVMLGMLGMLGMLSLPPAAWAAQTAAACPPGGAPIEVIATATNAHSDLGNVTFTLYGADPDKFLAHHGSIALLRAPIAAGTSQTCFAVSEPGTYAIAIYHDENDNHHFDRTLIGLPDEGYGFSNDAPALVGLPAFNDVRFTLAPGIGQLAIRLRY